MRGSLLVVILAAGCSGSGSDPTWPTSSPVGPVDPEPQRSGDPDEGYRALLEENYVGCGVPLSAYQQAFGGELTYNLTAFETATGVTVVAPNCLQCHADTLNGELVIGLPNSRGDYTDDLSDEAVLAGALISDPLERDEWEKWKDRVLTVAPYTQTATVGVNPADNLAAILFAHRDRDTLAWNFEPMLELPPDIVVPVDVPPWWHMKKKNAMFYAAAGRGDHARIMMTASTLCVDDVDQARAIDEYFPDIRSYLLTLEPPANPNPIDDEAAERGRLVFAGQCASCHGTYGGQDSYPNLVVASEEIGTDEVLALGASQFAERFVTWYNESFFGELSYLAPAPGYIAPPLDGIWATAPYLHNGSVPTLRALLDPPSRPAYWRRDFAEGAYDTGDVGVIYTAVEAGGDKWIYDTTRLGYGNGGHAYGDALTDQERDDLLEYLKTL